MKKLGKVVLSAGIILSGGALTSATGHVHEAEAAVMPYYIYNGYAGYHAGFLASNDFVKAVYHNNVTFNKIKLDLTPIKKGSSVVKTQSGRTIYDQNFGFYNGKKTAFVMSMPVKNKSLIGAQIKKAYKNYPHSYSSRNHLFYSHFFCR